MCDYSLHHVRNRPAKAGDQLVTTEFVNSATRGFCAVGEPSMAVCLLPGTEIAFEKEVKRQMNLLNFLRRRSAATLNGKLACSDESIFIARRCIMMPWSLRMAPLCC